MITFLSPVALLGGLLLAIPVAIHLFKPRRVRRTPFSSLRWLHLSQQKLARRIKWHQVLLFLLRAAFIALLVLAIAKPVLSPRGSVGALVDRYIVLDVSRSMNYRAAGRPTPIELGKNVAAKIIRQGLPGDRTTVLLTGSTTRSLGPPSRDSSIYLAALQSIQAGATDTNLGSALQVIRPMLTRRLVGAQVEIDFITDNDQRAWSDGDIAAFVNDLDVPVNVRVVDVSVSAAQNAWIADARLISMTRPRAMRGLRVQIGCAGDAGPSRTLRVAGLSGVDEMRRAVSLEAGKLTQVEFELPASFDPRGQVARISIEPDDALPEDDTFFLDLDARDVTNVLLVEGDSTPIESMRPGFYLRAALRALSTDDGRAIKIVNKSAATVEPADFAGADVVLMADVPSLSDPNLGALETRIKSGGGLVIFLGPSIEPTFYNTKLYRPQLPSDGLLFAPLRVVANAPPQRLDALTDIRWSHPLLAPLHDPVLSDLAQALFHSHYIFESTPTSDEVLAMINGRAPAMVDRSFGFGRIVLFNTTANDMWSDLPRRKSFVPLIDGLLNYLSGGSRTSATFTAGESINLQLANRDTNGPVTIIAPDGNALVPTIQLRAGRTMLHIDNVQTPGVYRVQRNGDGADVQIFVVQVGREDSVLTPIDGELLKKWWEPQQVEIVTAEMLMNAKASDSSRRALSPWLIGAACAVLLAEMFLVHRLCPRMNPKLVASVVPRRGMFSPSHMPPENIGV